MDGYRVLVSKSTVPIGTHKLVAAEVCKHYQGDFSVASNPEFLKEGTAVEDFLKPDRVVLGVTDERAGQTLSDAVRAVHAHGRADPAHGPGAAELTKYAANGFLAAKISFMNEIASLCEATGADIDLVRTGVGSGRADRQRLPLRRHRLRRLAASPRTCARSCIRPASTAWTCASLDAADAGQRAARSWSCCRSCSRTSAARSPGATVAVWGLAFKPRTDDIREAPALA